jgi:hypothetical protein
MAVDVAIDNDIASKAVAYGISRAFWSADDGELGLLGAAPYVIPKVLERYALGRLEEAKAELASVFGRAELLEPDDAEVQLAAKIEAAAQREGLALDGGESQLAAMTMERGIAVLETGDKRAVGALQSLRGRVDELERLDGRIRSLEQVVRRLAQDEAQFAVVAAAICQERQVDKTLGICFGCLSGGADRDNVLAGLDSYISALRTSAPDLLS